MPEAPAEWAVNVTADIVSEVQHDSCIFSSRLSKTQPVLEFEGNPSTEREDWPVGDDGYIRWEYDTNADFSTSLLTAWEAATSATDGRAAIKVTGLTPDTVYYWRAQYGHQDCPNIGPTHSFKTMPALTAEELDVNFAVTSCIGLDVFRDAHENDPLRRAWGPHAYDSILKQMDLGRVQALIETGDKYYNDLPVPGSAQTIADIRKKNHRVDEMPARKTVVGQVAYYGQKDDHDFRTNDSGPADPGLPTTADSLVAWYEQVPVTDTVDQIGTPYRATRVGELAELFFLEVREYRDPASDPDDVNKSLLGATQLAWLKQALLDSDAAGVRWQIIVTPTPAIGPNKNTSQDGWTYGYTTERDAFFQWLEDNLSESQVLFVCGDRHWQYVSKWIGGGNKQNFWEVCCGCISEELAQSGVEPGDADSTDPNGDDVDQKFFGPDPNGTGVRTPYGGWMRMQIKNKNGNAQVNITMFNAAGVSQHTRTFSRPL